jgi:tRNA (cmo5U34)-methyltransferase
VSDEGARSDRAWSGFDWTRERYEELIRKVVPEYGLQESLIAEAIRGAAPQKGQGPFRVLELGSGTGTLSSFLLETFPQAELKALDISPVMVADCQDVLAPFGGRAQVMEADFAVADLGSGFHAVVSRLAVHHLDDEERQALYRRVFEALLPGGVFVDCDLFVGETEAESEATRTEWRDYMSAQGDDPAEWEEWLTGDGDYPATARDQVAWLAAAGFSEIRTIWKRMEYAIVRAARGV